MTDKVKVAVRVRPFNRREIELGTKCVVDMEKAQTILYHPSIGVKESGDSTPQGATKKTPKTFAFDNCFWSMEESNPKFACQEKVFNSLGRDILGRAFEGYNACIFAYGQTGSGKSYTMMGTHDNKGIIPRLCDTLFDSIATNTEPSITYKVEVSYMEIYNERVRDLLDPNGKHNLRVREHNILGPYVDGLSTLAVSSFEDINNLMCEGNKSRTVAATNMNSESSRSHAVFNIILTQTLTDTASGVSGEKVSKMSLVDLAGSERAQKTGAVGERLKEGSNINKSLTTLGLVISALADSGKSKTKFVPYRDSVLTWLLKDNLGGNSKTVMVATLSPAADNYEETLSTLRYADRAKRIVNYAVVNEDPNARIIRELREEVEELRSLLATAQNAKVDGGGGGGGAGGGGDLQEKLEESEKLMNEMSKTWEQKLKETEAIHQERHAALEKMGISVQMSGIKVGQGKYYLVNLNADPSLNELLVYYLKPHTLVGRPDAPGQQQDIQLSGLGVAPQHAVIDVSDDSSGGGGGGDVYITPMEGARTCVNGKTITSKVKVKNGDRILLGNYHFFRINCPKINSPSTETPQNIDYEFAQHELMVEEMGQDPIQDAISAVEKEHEKDKEEALSRQRQMYERQMQMLRSQMMSPSSSTPSMPYPPFPGFFPSSGSVGALTPTASAGTMHPKYQLWAQEREKLFKQSLSKLKEEVIRANALVREANFLAAEMGKNTDFSVTLQIPAANLTPNRKRGAFVSEPAILVKRKSKGSQVWSMEKFENKIIDMRDMYEDRKEKGLSLMVEEPNIIYLTSSSEDQSDERDTGPIQKGDPFYELQENHNLIGVANVFLEALFYDVKLDYHVPIISQQGEVSGRLHIELQRMSGSMPRDRQADAAGDAGYVEMDEDGVAMGASIVCRVSIKEARGLPPALAHFVFCQYAFWGHGAEPSVVPPVVNSDVLPPQRRSDGVTVTFDHHKDFTVTMNEEFLEHCMEGALSIEVWGHRSTGFGAPTLGPGGWEIDQVAAKSLTIMDRWSELTRKLELWFEIHELNEQGEYMPVEVVLKPEVLTGGVFQLRQGHSRRIMVQVKPVQNSGTLPIICESISLVSIGCVTARSKLQKGLDSYQEEDLSVLRQKWSDALAKRRDYLDEQLQKIMSKEDKSESDSERERSLIDQWVCLTEERNAVLVPAAGSGIPGAPAAWHPPPGMETHVPVIFLNLNADDMSTPSTQEGVTPAAAGNNSILPKEHGTKFYTLPFVKNSEKDVVAVVSWDSSIHDSVHLNRVTPANERVYLIVKCMVRLSHPQAMDLVLRKRICINVYKRQSITDKLKKRIGKAVLQSVTGAEYFQDTLYSSGVTYEVVSNIPKSSEDLEARESLAQIAASGGAPGEAGAADGESYIEKYIRGVSGVDSVLTLDRLRQEVTIKEMMNSKGNKMQTMRKATSVPNMHSILSPGGVDKQLRCDSTSDLSGGAVVGDYQPERHGNMPKHFSLDSFRQQAAAEPGGGSGKAFSLASPVGVCPAAPGGGGGGKLRPLLEETPLLPAGAGRHDDDDDESEDDEFARFKEEKEHLHTLDENAHDSDSEFTDFQGFHSDVRHKEVSFTEHVDKPQPTTAQSNNLTHSSTTDSLGEGMKGQAPSVTSSGYASQAVSTNTLSSSEDSSSVRSISIDDTPDVERKAQKAASSAQCATAHTDHHDMHNDSVDATATEDKQPRESSPKLQARNANGADDRLNNIETCLSPISNFDERKTEQVLSENEQSAESDGISKSEFGDTKDIYSENALEELEQYDLGQNDTFASPASKVLERPADGNVSHVSIRAIPEDFVTENSENDQKVVKEDVEKGLSEVKLRKTHNLDISRSGNIKKLKSDGKQHKTSPSPVKATYRPVSMPIDMMSLEESGECDEHHSGELSDGDDGMSVCSFGSRADLHRLGEAAVPGWVAPGEPVLVLFSAGGSRPGTVQFVGHTQFASGNWVGVALETAHGKNDGSVKGVRYFKCRPQHGVFVRHDKIIMDKKRKSTTPQKMKTMSSSLRKSTGNLSSSQRGRESAGLSPGAGDTPSYMRPTSSSSAARK